MASLEPPEDRGIGAMGKVRTEACLDAKAATGDRGREAGPPLMALC